MLDIHDNLDLEANAYPLLYSTRKDNENPPHPVWLRDQLANFELTMAVSELGIARPASAIINMPPQEAVKPKRLLDWHELLEVDLGFVQPGDFLILTTRPPKDDIEEGNRKWVEPGQTKLERYIFRTVQKYLAVCARSHIKLAPFVRDALPSGFGGRGNFSTYQSGPYGFYREMNEGRGWVIVEDQRRTKIPCFVMRLDALWEGGPGIIIAFSMDAMSTAAWCWRLRRDLSHVIAQPGFHFYEMTPHELPQRPTDQRWAAQWEVERIVALPPAA